jgi:hypothetical protein
MDDKSLRNKAVDIKGKQYVLVSDRVLYFNETYKDGSITTELLSKPEDPRVVVKATVKFPMGDSSILFKQFTGHSQALIGDGYINKTSALENAETSAVGRALALMGIGVIDSVASADELHKASEPRQAAPQRTKPTDPRKDPAVELLAQKDRVVSLLKQLGFKPVGKTVAEKRAEVEEAVKKHAHSVLIDDDLEAIAEILSAKVEQLEAVGDQ